MEKKFMLRFVGKKADLHDQLKRWCEENGRTMNGTILELIQNHLKKVAK